VSSVQARDVHDAAPHAALVEPQHALPPPQSSMPSHVAVEPLQLAPAGWHSSPITGPAQHCMAGAHTPALPHLTPSAPPDPAEPMHVPATQVCPAGHACVGSQWNAVPV
jgi:hypothetical protein